MNGSGGNGKGGKSSGADGRSVPASLLMVGRLSVVRPQFGEFRVCQDVDRTLAAAFISYDSGRKHPVSRALLAQFHKPGQRRGWAYFSADRPFVFQFREQPDDRQARPWVSIECQGCRVALRPSLQRRTALAEGSWVACRAQRRRQMGPGEPALTALNVSPVGVPYPCTVRRLVSDGTVNARDHAELLEKLLSDLAERNGDLSRRLLPLWVEALTSIACMSGLPQDLRATADSRKACIRRQLEAAPELGSTLPPTVPTVTRQARPEPAFARA